MSKYVVVILALLVVLGLGIYLLVESDGVEEKDDQEIEKENLKDEEFDNDVSGSEDSRSVDYLSKIDLEDSPSMGDEDAPVKMVNYSSYYCPFCGAFKKDIFPKIKEEYIDTGKVEYFYKDSGDPQDQVFLSAHCAGMQDDVFFEFQEILYEEGVQREEDLFDHARDFDLDMDKFKECMEDACCAYIIEQTQYEMRELNITGVPYFIINNTALSGAQSFESMSAAIDEELSKKGE